MSRPQTAPYGAWKSPFTTDLMLSESRTLGLAILDGPEAGMYRPRTLEGCSAIRNRREVANVGPGDEGGPRADKHSGTNFRIDASPPDRADDVLGNTRAKRIHGRIVDSYDGNGIANFEAHQVGHGGHIVSRL